jgi:hypothetical protein
MRIELNFSNLISKLKMKKADKLIRKAMGLA